MSEPMRNKTTDRLSEILKDGIDVHRCGAARALGVMKNPKATEVLVSALMDEDPDVRVDAAMSLAEIQDPTTAEKLMENLTGDPESDVKKAALDALVAMEYAPIIPLLRALTTSRAPELVAWDEGEFYADGWDNWDDIQLASIKALGELGIEDAVPEVLDAMADEMGQDVSVQAFTALAKMGAAGARAMASMYEVDDARLRRRIARAVGASDNPHLTDLHSEMLTSPTGLIRAIAVENLAESDPRLAEMFVDIDAQVRVSAVRQHGAKNLPLLADMIADSAPSVRVEVFKVIAENPDTFGDKDIIEAVKGTLKGDPEAAKHAALALFALQGPKVAKGFSHVLGNTDIPRDFRIGVLETLEKSGEAAVPALLGVAADDDRQLRLASLTVLANIAEADASWPNAAGEGLLAALKGELVLPPEEEAEPEPEPEPEVELEQAELDEIAKEIDESLPLVAEDAAEGSTLRAIMENKPLETVKEPEEIVLDETQARLLKGTNTRNFRKRKVSWTTEVAPHLDVQRFSARLLGQVVNPEVTAALVETLSMEIDDETRDGILFSLAMHGIGGATLPADLRDELTALLDSEVSETRVLATRVLGWLACDDIVDVMTGLLDHSDVLVRVEAVQALDHHNIANDAIISALDDPYMGVGIAAARLLARNSGEAAVDALVKYAVKNDGTYRRDIGRLFGQYAPEAGAARLLELLNDEKQKTKWLVALDALAELFQYKAPEAEFLAA